MPSLFRKWILVLLVIVGLYGLIQLTPLQEILTPEKLTSFLRDLGGAGPFALMGLMMLAAGTGVELTVSARGPDAVIALDALVRFVDCGFVGDCQR